MTIKEFCERYNNITTQKLKDDFIKENVKITPYIPVLKKDALADIIVNRTVFEQETYTAEDGTTKMRSTGTVKVNSFIGYIMFVRTLIEVYTNLEVDKDHFDTDYDALKTSGLLDKFVSGEKSLIPHEEIAELNTIIGMKKDDILTTESSIDMFIKRQIDRFKDLGEATLLPLVDVVKDKLDNISKEDMGKIIQFVKNGDFKEV